MKQIFVAFDNTTHSTAEECLKHEANHLAYRAFDEDGEAIYELKEAQVIYIFPEGGAKVWDDLDKADRTTSGIGARSTGWFFLCEECMEWNPLSVGLIRLFSQELL